MVITLCFLMSGNRTTDSWQILYFSLPKYEASFFIIKVQTRLMEVKLLLQVKLYSKICQRKYNLIEQQYGSLVWNHCPLDNSRKHNLARKRKRNKNTSDVINEPSFSILFRFRSEVEQVARSCSPDLASRCTLDEKVACSAPATHWSSHPFHILQCRVVTFICFTYYKHTCLFIDLHTT